jgi:hypothetical protein
MPLDTQMMIILCTYVSCIIYIIYIIHIMGIYVYIYIYMGISIHIYNYIRSSSSTIWNLQCVFSRAMRILGYPIDENGEAHRPYSIGR